MIVYIFIKEYGSKQLIYASEVLSEQKNRHAFLKTGDARRH